jgi:hypothetical protein
MIILYLKEQFTAKPKTGKGEEALARAKKQKKEGNYGI